MKCNEYLIMLIQTGFNKSTNPEIFKKDVLNLEKHCNKDEAYLTTNLINKNTFNFGKYNDLSHLMTSISGDLIRYDKNILETYFFI